MLPIMRSKFSKFLVVIKLDIDLPTMQEIIIAYTTHTISINIPSKSKIGASVINNTDGTNINTP